MMQPCLTPTAEFEGLRGAAIELHSTLHVAVEGLLQALQLGWAANLWQDFEEAISADKVECLGPFVLNGGFEGGRLVVHWSHCRLDAIVHPSDVPCNCC